MVERSKPEPDIFLLGCEKTGVTPEEAVVLEDSEMVFAVRQEPGSRRSVCRI